MIKKVNKGIHAGQWQVRIQPVDKITGKRISIPVAYVDSKRDANKLEKQMWDEYKAGLNLGDGNAEFAESFQKYVDQRANSISKVTLKAWQESADSFKNYFKKAKISQITTQLVSNYTHDYVNKHNVTVSNSSTIAKRLVHMRNFFSSIEGKSIKINPVPERALKTFFKTGDFSLPKKWRIFSKDELEKMRSYLKVDLRSGEVYNNGSKLAILIESYTGMRVGELQAVKFDNLIKEDEFWTLEISNSWSDYTNDFTGSLKARPKGASRILLPLTDDVVDLIKQYQRDQKAFLEKHNLDNPHGLMFINLHDYKSVTQDQPISQKGFNDMLRKLCKKLEINSNDERMSLYSFRHSICTHLANTPDMSFTWAADKMGHSLQMFMKTYVGVDPSINKKMNQLWMS